MSNINKQSLREKFEAWWEVNYHNGNPPRFGWEHWRDGDGYKIDDDESELDGMWESWQAAHSSKLEAAEKRIAELMEKQRLIDICQGQGLEHRIAAEKRAESAEKRIAEFEAREAVKPIGYFAYDTEGGFTNHDTAERAQKEAQDSIEYFRETACDGWSDEVDSVCWGVILQQAEKVDERPVTDDDKCASHIECYCDYSLLPGVNFAACITTKGE